jgi:tetratricopeptide (TPR) repeat protein/predicted aspartyl protease
MRAALSGFLLALVLAPAPALADCKAGQFADIPVTMAGRRPIVTAQINGRDARFVLDSGAFFSTIARANALEYGLGIRSLGPNVKLKGIGGSTSLGVTTAQAFTLAGQTIRNIDFAVGGSDTGYAGLLGQNILGLRDIEYDLPHGAVRLFKTQDCKTTGLAYWAGSKPFTLVDLQPANGPQRTVGTVLVNGVKVKAMFDTGAGSSMMTLEGARRVGIKPDSPGVASHGFAQGVGSDSVRTWRARFDTIDIGGETIRGSTLQIIDQSIDGIDMLIGIDFFLTHRVFVDNQTHRMFVTYEGGPFFGLDPKRAVDDKGEALDMTDTAGEPADAAGYSQRGAVFLTHGKLDEALADFDRAVALAPDTPQYLLQRARAHLAKRQILLASGDLDKAIALAPSDPEARLLRAPLRLAAKDPTGALADLDAADQALAASSDARLRLAGFYAGAERHDRAVANYDQWLKYHPDDPDRATAFNGRCWGRAVLNSELGYALNDCNAALKLRPNAAAYLDSRALVRLRRGELDKALADYDAAIAAKPREAWTLYSRGLVERRLGKVEQADADRALALSINPRVGERAKRYGLEE